MKWHWELSLYIQVHAVSEAIQSVVSAVSEPCTLFLYLSVDATVSTHTHGSRVGKECPLDFIQPHPTLGEGPMKMMVSTLLGSEIGMWLSLDHP